MKAWITPFEKGIQVATVYHNEWIIKFALGQDPFNSITRVAA